MRTALAALLLTLILTMSACDTGEVCPEGYEYTTQYTYHYGYNMFNGKYEFFFGPESKCYPV